MVEPVLHPGGMGGMLPGGCGTAGALAGLWGLAALVWVCNKGLRLSEIPSASALSPLGQQCPGRGAALVLLGSPLASLAVPGACDSSGWCGGDTSSQLWGTFQPVLCLTLSSSMWGGVRMRGPPDTEGAAWGGGAGDHVLVPHRGHAKCWCLEPDEALAAVDWKRQPGWTEGHPPLAGSSPRVSAQVIRS